jgi:hypothetical protein
MIAGERRRGWSGEVREGKEKDGLRVEVVGE